MSKLIYWVPEPLHKPFFFTNKREAEKAVKYLQAKYPDEDFEVYEEDVWLAEEVKHHCDILR